MLCKRCGGELRIISTYKSRSAKTQLAICKDCRHKHTLVTTIFNDFEGSPEFGTGPYAVLKAIEKAQSKTD